MRISFYMLNKPTHLSCLDFACKLLEKAFSQHFDIQVSAATTDLLQELDKALWNYSATGFIPHELKDSHIQIQGLVAQPARALLDLRLQEVAAAEAWQRVLYIVPQDVQLKNQAQYLQTLYQEKNFPTEIHTIKG
jgi:DNA polymerase-3 subunit chi